MAEVKRPSLVKPTVNTPFHIDFDWWQRHDREWRVHLRSCLPPEQQQAFIDADDEEIDWIDPETAEVQRIDGLQHALIRYAAVAPDFITQRTTLVEAIFRTLLVNGNIALTPAELGLRLNRPANVILRTIGGRRVYKGIRPCPECAQ
ncbi:MAG TPA: hypothetical protein EYP88_04685 [Anaerolineales bacterium]|nr:hypothetical protein [Anaerolineales bacterium]